MTTTTRQTTDEMFIAELRNQHHAIRTGRHTEQQNEGKIK